MSEANKINTGYITLLTLVATLGGLLFGYDTAVISGTTDSIEAFFINPLIQDSELSISVITEFKVVSTLCFLIVGVVFSFLFFKLFHNNLTKSLLASLTFCFIIGYILYSEYLSQPGEMNEHLAKSVKGFVLSSALFGCIIGGGIAGFVSQKYGRKTGLIISAILFTLSALGSALPDTLNFTGGTVMSSFVLYRIIGGIGVGMASMLSPMYIAEIAPASIRGKLVSWNQFSIVFGMLVVYFVNYSIAISGEGMDNTEWLNTVGWRWMFASELIPALLFFGMLFLVPESPRFLVMKGDEKGAASILSKITDRARALVVVDEIKLSLKEKSAPWLSYGALIIVIGVLLSAFQQLVGINAVLYYAPDMFKSIMTNSNGLEEAPQQLSGKELEMYLTIIVGAINMLFTVLAIFTVDKMGRKKLQIIGAIAMGVAMLSLGTALFVEDDSPLALIAIFTYVAGFALSWGPVTWVLLSEIFPNSIKGAMGLAVAVQWFVNYIVSWTFPMMNESQELTDNFHGGFAYWIYGSMSVLAAIFVWKFVPETKGKTLEDMATLWKKKQTKN